MTVRHVLLAAVLGGACASHAGAEPPPECGTTAIAVERVEALQARGEADAALSAAGAIRVNALPSACRVYVRALEAELYIATGDIAAARARYVAILDEVPWWRPSSGRSNPAIRRLFEEVRAEWVRTNAGPLRVTPNVVSLLSPASDVPSTAQPLLIQSMQQGEVSWRVRSEDPWIHVSRRVGTTIGGRDTVVVSARPPEWEPPGTQRGRLLFEAPPWPDVPVEVSWEIVSPEIVATEPPRPLGRLVLFVTVGAAVVGTIVGLAAF